MVKPEYQNAEKIRDIAKTFRDVDVHVLFVPRKTDECIDYLL
jgi:hypothetical protein